MMAGAGPALIAVEVGATKISAAVSSAGGELLGLAVVPLSGPPDGTPATAELSSALRTAVAEANAMAGTRGRRIWLALNGPALRYRTAKGMVRVAGPGRKVTRADLERALEAAAPPLPGTIHRLFVGASLDGREVLEDPFGLVGERLEAGLLLVEVDETHRLGLEEAAAGAGLEIAGFVAGVLALEFVLSPAEREIGTAAIDLGATHTAAAVYLRGRLRAVAVLGLGGLHVTKDLSVAFGLSRAKAEELKIAAFSSDGDWRATPAGKVAAARLGEILELIRDELALAGWMGRLPGGFVLTGGGAIPGNVLGLAEEILGGPVRCGFPRLEQVGSMVAGPGFAVILGAAQAVRAYGKGGGPGVMAKGVARWRSWCLQRLMRT